MENSIRIDSGTKRIEVNDNGDVILLPLGDDGFVRDFYKLVDSFREKAQTVTVDENDIVGSMDRVSELNAGLRDQTDKLFGEGSCKKVFGDITPGVDLFLEFFTQLLPFFEEHTRKRVARMNKYSAGRSGSV